MGAGDPLQGNAHESRRPFRRPNRWVLQAVILSLSIAAALAPATAQTTLFDPQIIYERTAPAVGVVRVMTNGRTGIGTGFAIDADGYVLTAGHVARGAGGLAVEFPGDRPLQARIIGYDARRDLAFLRVTPTTLLPSVEVATGGLRAGEPVVVIGTPRGRPGVMTVGEVVAPRASLPGLARESLIRISAPVAPGNSGGPVLNGRGQAVGLVVARSGGGDALAVSGSTILSTLPALREGARVERPWIGIAGRTLSPEVARERQLSIDHGALIQEVLPASPAAAADLRLDDVITALDGRPIGAWEDLLATVAEREPWQRVRLTVLRGAARLDVQVTLGIRP